MKFGCLTFKLKILVLIIVFAVALPVNGQNGNKSIINSSVGPGSINISSVIERQTAYIKSSYSAMVEAPKEIINGKEYESYYIRSQSKPLLFLKKKRSATLLTTSRTYTNLTLDYDTFLDEVIYTDTSMTINYSFPKIALNNNIIIGFNLYFEDDSMKFKYLKPTQSIDGNLKEGFYETVYEGKSKYIIKHVSSYYVREGLNEYKYSPENYISAGGAYYKITGKGSLLKLFGADSPAIKKFLHLSRIRIRQANKNEYISILKYYDSLTKVQ